MATGSKTISGYNDWFPVPNLLPNAPKGFDWGVGPRGLYDPGEPQRLKTGAFDITLPTDPSTYPARPAARVRTYFEDFYNRIYIEPALIDFGAITSDAQVSVQVWNAFYGQPVTLSQIQYNEQSGLRIEGAALPNTIPPLGLSQYRVTALARGPALLNETIRWSFDLPWTFDLPVSGSRVRLLGLEPAWPPSGQTYKVSYSFSTAIGLSRSGKEQRIANRTFPRKQVGFQSQISQDSFRAFKDRMWYWQHRPFAIPEIPRRAESSGPMLTGEDTMRFPVVPFWAVPEAQVILAYLGTEDIRVVASVDGDRVRFKTRSGQSWPPGTVMHPGLTGNVASNVSTPRLTNAVATVTTGFDVTPLSEPNLPLSPAPARFNGRELFLKKPNWSQRVEGAFVHESEILDYGRGPVNRETPIEFGTETRRGTYLNRNFEEAEYIRELFFRMKGRQGEFYMPTWEYDFRPAVTQFEGTAGFRVAGLEFAAMYGASTVHKALFVQLENGAILTRRVLSLQPVTDGIGSDSLITVDEPWEYEISEETVVMAGWMPVWRFISDDLTVEWLTDKVANVQLNMMTLEDLPVETA